MPRIPKHILRDLILNLTEGTFWDDDPPPIVLILCTHCPGRTGGSWQMNRLKQWFLGITGWDPSVCKSDRLHVDILHFSFIKLGYIL